VSDLSEMVISVPICYSPPNPNSSSFTSASESTHHACVCLDDFAARKQQNEAAANEGRGRNAENGKVLFAIFLGAQRKLILFTYMQHWYFIGYLLDEWQWKLEMPTTTCREKTL
jgi:hypothetical protein